MNDPHLLESQLKRSLAGGIDEQEESVIVRHLNRCSSCRTKLEQLAVEDQQWSPIGDALKAEADSQLSLGAASASHRLPFGSDQPDVPIYPSDYATAPADFAVSFLEPSTRPDSIGRLGEFEILSVIGCGGMGIVLKGFQEELNRPVAVKVLAPHLATSGAARQRFLREAQATAAIVHPNVMPILSVSEKSRLPLLVMPYVACHSLQQRLDADGPLPLLDLLRIAIQVAHGLAAAHSQGLVHRDVKPANILLERGIDRAMLTDFGLARAVDDATLTRSGVIAGTPQYMSPEQARGDAIDTRSDLFSFGSVIYAMCAGRPPFRAETSYGILRRITDHTPRSLLEVNTNVPAWLDRLVQRLLTKDAQHRYASAQDVAVLLENCLAHVQQPTVVPLPVSLQEAPAARALKVPKFVWGAMAVLAIMLGIGLVYDAVAPPAGLTARDDGSPSPSPSAADTSQDEFTLHGIAADGQINDAQISDEISHLQRETERIVRNAEAIWPPADEALDDVKSVTVPLPVLPHDSTKGN